MPSLVFASTFASASSKAYSSDVNRNAIRALALTFVVSALALASFIPSVGVVVARWSAVKRFSSFSSIFMLVAFVAHMSGVRPSLSVASTFAPRSRRTYEKAIVRTQFDVAQKRAFVSSTFPSNAAQCSAVHPISSVASMSAPRSRRIYADGIPQGRAPTGCIDAP